MDKLHILMIEDNPDDAALTTAELRRAGYLPVTTLVQDEAMLRAALATGTDIVLIDYSLPQFSALDALKVVSACNASIPAVIVSGTISAETAIELMRAGAKGYVDKQRLVELGPVVKRALHDAQLQREHEAVKAVSAGQVAILEKIATHAPLDGVLAAVIELIESQCPEMMGSILLLDPEGQHIVTSIAPSLPEIYSTALVGLSIGPTAGSCGTAMYRGEQVVVSDILQDPLWEDYRELANAHGLRACWSTPIFSSSDHRVRGAFAMYYRETRSPGKQESELIRTATHIAGIAIESHDAEESIRQSRQMYADLVNALEGIVWEADAETGAFFFVSRYAEILLGYPTERWMQDQNFWRDHLHPADRSWVIDSYEKAIRDKRNITFEFRMQTADDHTVWLRDIATLTDSRHGGARLRGIMFDITAHKALATTRNLLLDVTLVIAEAPGFGEALERTLELICTATGCRLGQAWMPHDGTIVCRPECYAADAQSEAFHRISLECVFRRGQGLPGQVWDSKVPRWLSDLADAPNFPRRVAAEAAQLGSAFAVPVVSEGTIVAVLEFLADGVHRMDRELLEAVTTITSQLGTVMRRKQAEDLAQDNAERFQLVTEVTNDAVYDWDVASDQTWWNDCFRTLFGMPDDASGGPSMDEWGERIHPDHRAEVTASFQATVFGNDDTWTRRYRLRRTDGSWAHVYDTCRIMRDGMGKPLRVIGSIRDMSEQERLQAEIENSRIFLNQIYENLPLGVYVKDMTDGGRIIAWNAACERIIGTLRADALGHTMGEIIPGGDVVTWHRNDLEVVNRKCPVKEPGLVLKRADGNTVIIDLVKLPLTDADSVVRRMLCIAEDVTERNRYHHRLLELAHYDVLTGIPNREFMQMRLQEAVNRARRNGTYAAVLFIDVDRFKVINDSLGHAAGDVVLKQIAQRLKTSIRGTDVVARVGGDEFIVLLEDMAAPGDSETIANKLLSALGEPFIHDDLPLYTTVSIGIGTFPGDGEEPHTLVKNADAAMYSAKAVGRNNYQHYKPEMNVSNSERLQMESELHVALEQEQFLLHYQPVINLMTGTITGVEALVRWQHPKRGLVPPLDFIPLAEESGIIMALGEWVLAEACRQAGKWVDGDGKQLKLAVNLSPRQLNFKDIVTRVAALLETNVIAASALTLEVTESVLMQNPEMATKTLRALSDLGVKIAVDDFGTGYSSLAYLKQFPIDFIKIDRAFVQGVPGNENDSAIVQTIIAMAHQLGIHLIAEGIETAEQAECLKRWGCEEAQGYLFSRPIPAADIEAALRAHSHDPEP